MTRFVLAMFVLACSARAHAQSGAPLGETSRTASLGGANVGGTNDPAAIHDNPGALARIDRSIASVGAHVGRVHLTFAREGEGSASLNRNLNGVSAAAVARLGGPEWLRRVRIGAAFHVPMENALRIDAPPRLDQPISPIYGDRAGRTAVTASLGVELPFTLGLGVGVTLTPTLYAPTVVRYDATRSDDIDRNVVVELHRELQIGAAVLTGITAQPLPEVGLGFAFRGKQTAAAVGPNDTVAGPVRVDAAIDFLEFFAPATLALGAVVRPFPELMLALDASYAIWSEFRSIQNAVPTPGFHDTVEVRFGAEWLARDFFAVRAGYAFEPTPVPMQSGVQSFLDADRHVLSLGLGLDLEKLRVARMRIDVHGRVHALARQHAVKDPATLGDADPDAPGVQIDNLGYPGFTSSGSLLQLGVTLSFPLEGPP